MRGIMEIDTNASGEWVTSFTAGGDRNGVTLARYARALAEWADANPNVYIERLDFDEYDGTVTLYVYYTV